MLKFKGEENLVIVYQTQTHHQKNLIFNELIPCLTDKYKSNNEILNVVRDWGLQELCNYCFISTYHLWEKQVSHIIRSQSEKAPTNDFVFKVKALFNEKFNIDCISDVTWNFLKDASLIVNAFKHGEGSSLEKVNKTYPEIVLNDTETHHSFLKVNIDLINKLLDSMSQFYISLEEETDLDFSNWSK